MSYKAKSDKSHYKRLGDYIELVNQRNEDLAIDILLGLSISKEFIPSVANTIGTNMKRYKIVEKNQFACSIMQVRRDGKMPVAILKSHDKAIISQAYPVFKVKDESVLNPDYLMMWFKRKEFDREATFHAVGGVRGSLEWEDFMNFKLPIPSIEKQRQIVAEYNAVDNRIRINDQLDQKLEETAQTIYKHWFVDFEFPNENGQPYKTSGGKMVYNEELDKEIPEGWEVEITDNCTDVLFGYSFDSKLFTENDSEFPLVRIRDIISNRAETFTSEIVDDKYIIKSNDILIGMDGKFHCAIWFGVESLLNQRVARIRERNDISIYKIYFSIQDELFALQDSIFGTTVSHLSNGDVRSLKLLKTPLDREYKSIMDKILIKQHNAFRQNQKLIDLKSLILSKMSKVEIEKEMV